MTDHKQAAIDLARRVNSTALEKNKPTRFVAQSLLQSVSDWDLLRFMAAEFLVDLIDRSRQRPALRVAEPPPTPIRQQRQSGKLPRIGTRERRTWEAETTEGRAYRAALDSAGDKARADFHDRLHAITAEYTESLRVQWTEELLDQTFPDATGAEIPWGEATAEQHEQHATKLRGRAGESLREAALHQLAADQLRTSGTVTLRYLVGAA